ncbi:MAG: hypothetical protein H3C31_13045 [Brumimicrobium sp.]|nr:hypothetical protein [Brumimicrobium sp.]
MNYSNKKYIGLLILLLLSFSTVFSQDAITLLKFETAEKAFNSGDYEKVLHQLDEVEKTTGVMSKTLYLRIVSENALFDNGTRLYESTNQFEQLQRIRQHASSYLKALADQGLDDKYREINRISESLKSFPQDFDEWEVKYKEVLLIVEKEREEEARITEEIKKNEQLKQLTEEEIKNLNPKEKVQSVLNNFIIASGAHRAKYLQSYRMNVTSTTFNNINKLSQDTTYTTKIFTKEIPIQLFREFEWLEKNNFSFGGIERFDGKMAYVLKEKTMKYYYDVLTNLRIGIESITEIPNYGSMRMTVLYKDYKDFKGMKFATTTVTETWAKEELTSRSVIQINEIYMDEDFR